MPSLDQMPYGPPLIVKIRNISTQAFWSTCVLMWVSGLGSLASPHHMSGQQQVSQFGACCSVDSWGCVAHKQLNL